MTDRELNRDLLRQWLTDVDVIPTGEEVFSAESDLQQWAILHGTRPSDQVKEKMLEKIRNLNEQKQKHQILDRNNLPLLGENTNWFDWQEVVKDIAPPAELRDIYLHNLESNDRRELFLIWVKEYVPEEVHHDILESFLILEGSCECHIRDEQGNQRIVRMGPGDFITMQYGETHDIFVTSSIPAKAILQWLVYN